METLLKLSARAQDLYDSGHRQWQALVYSSWERQQCYLWVRAIVSQIQGLLQMRTEHLISLIFVQSPINYPVLRSHTQRPLLSGSKSVFMCQALSLINTIRSCERNPARWEVFHSSSKMAFYNTWNPLTIAKPSDYSPNAFVTWLRLTSFAASFPPSGHRD